MSEKFKRVLQKLASDENLMDEFLDSVKEKNLKRDRSPSDNQVLRVKTVRISGLDKEKPSTSTPSLPANSNDVVTSSDSQTPGGQEGSDDEGNDSQMGEDDCLLDKLLSRAGDESFSDDEISPEVSNENSKDIYKR